MDWLDIVLAALIGIGIILYWYGLVKEPNDAKGLPFLEAFTKPFADPARERQKIGILMMYGSTFLWALKIVFERAF